MRVIGETYSVEDMNELVEEFAKFNIKPDDIIGKTIRNCIDETFY